MKLFFMLAVVFMIVGAAKGAAIRLYHQDSDAIARGSASVATADDPSAIYYNPAGITQLEGHQFKASIYGSYYGIDYEGAGGVKDDAVDQYQGVGQLYYTVGLPNAPVAFGVGVYFPFGFGTEWKDDSPLRTLATKTDLAYMRVNPVVAWEIRPGLSIAAGPTINYADLSLARGLVAPGDELKFSGDGFAYGFNAGILWQPTEQLSFGITYAEETTVELEGDLDVRNFAMIPSGPAQLDFPFPRYVTAGVSYRPTPDWNIEVDVDWTDWDTMGTVTVESAVPIDQPLEWESGFTYLVGVTRNLGPNYRVSGGYIYSESAVPDKTYVPSVPDFAFSVFSLGLSKVGPKWNWSVGGHVIHGLSRTVRGSTPSLAGASADGNYDFLGLGVTGSISRRF